MTIEQFRAKYYLHDSSLVKVKYLPEKNFLALTIEFCFWAQSWYDKSEPKNGVIRVTFEEVSRFECDDDISDKIFSAELDSEIRDGEIDADGNFFIFAVECPDDSGAEDIYYRLVIGAANVEVAELERYNL